MKKYIYLFISLLMPLMALTSCNDDDDLPQVDVTVSFGEMPVLDNVAYVVAGQPFVVNSVEAKSLNGKECALGAVAYYWDGFLADINPIVPYNVSLPTAGMAPGLHVFQVKANIYQVDKSIAAAWLQYKVQIVESESDIPADAVTPPSNTTTQRSNQIQ